MAERRASERRTNYQSDHDLLIRVEEKQNITITQIAALTTGLNEGLNKKVDVSDFNSFKDSVAAFQNDHEARIRSNETFHRMALGALAFLQLVSLALGIYAFLK